MVWRLSSAAFRCQLRRLGRAGRAAPLPFALALVGLAIVPIALHHAGAGAADAVGLALREPASARALAVALAMSALGAGALMVAVLPGGSAFGAFVAASPAGGRAVLLAGSVVPAVVGAAPLLAALGLVLLPGLGRAPGGHGVLAPIGAALLASVLAGGAATECILQAWRGRMAAGLALAGVAGAWLACGLAGEEVLLGPAAATPSLLAGSGSVFAAVALSVVFASCVLAAWLLVGPGRPEPVSRTRRTTWVEVRRGGMGTVAVGMSALLLRRSDLRRALGVASTIGLGGLVLARLAGFAPRPSLQLAIAAVALGAAVVPLAAPGALVDGRTLWWAAPRRRAILWAPGAIGVSVLVATTLPLAGAAALGGSVGLLAVGQGEVLAAITALVAVCTGAAVPLRRARAGDQAVGMAAFACGGSAVGITSSQVGGRAVALGVPDAVVVSALCVALVGISAAATRARLAKG